MQLFFTSKNIDIAKSNIKMKKNLKIIKMYKKNSFFIQSQYNETYSKVSGFKFVKSDFKNFQTTNLK